MSDNQSLALRRLEKINENGSDKLLSISFFENAYKSWAYGNYFGFSKAVIDCFKEWSSLDEEGKNDIKAKFLKD